MRSRTFPSPKQRRYGSTTSRRIHAPVDYHLSFVQRKLRSINDGTIESFKLPNGEEIKIGMRSEDVESVLSTWHSVRITQVSGGIMSSKYVVVVL